MNVLKAIGAASLLIFVPKKTSLNHFVTSRILGRPNIIRIGGRMKKDKICTSAKINMTGSRSVKTSLSTLLVNNTK